MRRREVAVVRRLSGLSERAASSFDARRLPWSLRGIACAVAYYASLRQTRRSAIGAAVAAAERSGPGQPAEHARRDRRRHHGGATHAAPAPCKGR